MLIRFQIKNLYSFEAETEFNLLTNHAEELSHHKKHYNGIDILRQVRGQPILYTTEVHCLAQSIYPFFKEMMSL